jgi:5'-3' exonuclease
MERTIDDILMTTSSNEFSIALSGESNFRYQVYPEYKANRKDQVRPQFLTECKEYLYLQYNAEYSEDCEADDLLGIWQMEDINNTIICSLDKDLWQIPGMHYSWEISGTSKGTKWTKAAEIGNVSHLEGLRFFYTQMLVGDTADNVKGVSGVGKKTAPALLQNCMTEQEMFEIVQDKYSNDDEMLMNGQCLWIFRQPNDRWKLPTFKERESIE